MNTPIELTLVVTEKDDPFWMSMRMFNFLKKWKEYIDNPFLQEEDKQLREQIEVVENNGLSVNEIKLYDANGNLIRDECPEDCRVFPPKLTIDYSYEVPNIIKE